MADRGARETDFHGLAAVPPVSNQKALCAEGWCSENEKLPSAGGPRTFFFLCDGAYPGEGEKGTHIPLDLIPLTCTDAESRGEMRPPPPSFVILMKQKKLKTFDPYHQKKGKIRQRLGSATTDAYRPEPGRGVGNFISSLSNQSCRDLMSFRQRMTLSRS